MNSAPQPSTILAATEPATSRWISEATTRHTGTLLVYVVLVWLGNLVGAQVDGRTYLVFAVWIGANLVVAPWAARALDFQSRLRRYAASLVMDVLFLAVVYYFLAAAQWLGAVFFIHTALVAAATLPRRWAIAVGALILLVFGGLVWIAVAGPALVHSPVNLPPVRGNYTWAMASVAAAIGLIVVLLMMQLRLVESIRDAEERYLLLVRSAPDMVMTFDQEGHFLDVNPATLEQTGYSWAEIKLLPNTSFFPREDWQKIIDGRTRVLAGEVVEMDVRYVRRSGEVRWIQTRSATLRLRRETTAILVLARDVTETKRQTDALREDDARFRLVIGALDIGFVTMDTEGRLTAAYGRWAEGLVARGETLVGEHWAKVAEQESVEPFASASRRALAGENVTFHWTRRATDRVGEQFFRAHLVPLRDAEGTVTGIAGLWSNETAATLADRERETLREQLVGAERIESLGKLVSGVAHELNNPLAAILSFTEELLGDPRTGEDRLALEVIQAQALRSRTIVRDLLTFVRKGDRRTRRKEPPGPILETFVRAIRPGLATQGVAFSATITEPDTPLLLDRAGFEQVVTNLVTNAAQSAGAGGMVRLVARRSAGRYEVIVEDDGAGIVEENFAKIFEPFFTTKGTGQGVGLGLSVSLGIVQAHDGELLAANRSRAVGGGARFTMRIPVAEDPVVPGKVPGVGAQVVRDAPAHVVRDAPAPASAVPEVRADGIPSLLIVDDEESIRRALRRYFERRGWKVDEATDGGDALRKLDRPDAAAAFDVLLCDLKMPGVSGQELYHRLLGDRPAIARKFIFATGDTGAPDVVEFLAGVGVPVLEKPFELRELEELAQQVRGAA